MENKEMNDNINKEELKDNEKINKILIILIFIVATILIVSIIIFNSKVYKLFTYKNNFKEVIKNNVLNNLEYKTSESFEGKFCNKLTISLDNSFNQLDYEKQKDIISKASTQIRKYYSNYQTEVIKETLYDDIDTKELIFSLFFYVDEDCYEYDSYGKFSKNDKPYELENYLREKILAKHSIDDDKNSYLETISDSEILQGILNLETLEEANKEIIYQFACEKINTNEYKTSKGLFEQITDYKDSAGLLANLNNRIMIDGNWKGTTRVRSKYVTDYSYDVTHNWIINGNVCYNVFSSATANYDYNTYYCVFKDNILYVLEPESNKENLDQAIYKMKYENGNLTYTTSEYNHFYPTEMVMKKVSDNTTLQEKSYIKEPTIGMTKSEVEKSTWGKPNKINKDTYSWGTTEQWCYSNYRYIYFKNGYVTSISE